MKHLADLQDGHLVLLTADECERLQQPEQQDTRPTILDIPHRCQFGEGADERRNDCGAACVVMIVVGLTDNNPTVDDVAIAHQKRPNAYMGFWELMVALRVYKLTPDYVRPLRADHIRESLDSGRPSIVLAKYPHLPYKASQFTGSHFVVIVIYGYDGDEFYYHDSLACDGDIRKISSSDLETAMSKFDPGENRPYQGLIV